jgi:hypothetical protein
MIRIGIVGVGFMGMNRRRILLSATILRDFSAAAGYSLCS